MRIVGGRHVHGLISSARQDRRRWWHPSLVLHEPCGSRCSSWLADLDCDLRKLPKVGFTFFKYCTLTAVTAYVVPSILTIFGVSRLGAGLVSMTYALVPVLTYFLALVYRLEAFQLVRIGGVVCGFFGAVLMTLPDHANTDPANTVWVFIVLMIPVSLALSSIFRSVAWPSGYSPSELAAGMLFMSAVMLGLMSFWQGERYFILLWAQPEDWVVLVQMLAAFLSSWSADPWLRRRRSLAARVRRSRRGR